MHQCNKELACTVLGDDLYCRQPICTLISAEQLHFILVCKPDSHKTLYQWVEGLEKINGRKTLVEKDGQVKPIILIPIVS